MKYVHFHLVLAAAVVLICSGGCSRARWLSRKDYKELNDPFAAGSEMADADSSENSEFDAEADPVTAGRASLAEPKTAALPWQRPGAGSDEASTEEPAAAGPKPIIQQASGNSFDTNVGSVAQASYPDETPESLDESPQPAAFDPRADAPADVHTSAAAISSGDSAEELPELPAITDGESEHPFEAAEALAAEARQTNSVPASQETVSADAFSAAVTNDAVNEHQGDAAAAEAFSDSSDQTDDQPVNPFSLDRQSVSGSPAEDFAADVRVNSRTPAPAQSADILPDDQWSTDLNGMSDDIAQPLIPATKPGAQPSRNENPFGENPKATASPSVSGFSSKTPVWPATGLKQNTVPSAVPKPGVGQKPKKANVNPFDDELPSGDSNSGHSLPDFGSTDAELPPDFEAAESGDSDTDHDSKLDAGFDMDSGWKPSHAVKP
jgi:hypothetical protein